MISIALIAAWPGLVATTPATPAAAHRDSVRFLVSPAAKCPELRPRIVRPGAPVRPRRLGELPPGSLEFAVLREVDRCPIPAILRPDFTVPGR